MGMLDDFLDYSKKNKLDGLSDEEHKAYIKLLELVVTNLKENDDPVGDNDFSMIKDVVSKVTGCKVHCFEEDNCFIVENEPFDILDILNMGDDVEPKINMKLINQTLELKGYKAEFDSAYNFEGTEVEGFTNFLRFNLVKL